MSKPGGRDQHRGKQPSRRDDMPPTELAMPENVVIILHFRESQAPDFERLFEEEVLPLWREFKAQGKFIVASLSRVFDDHLRKGIVDYMLYLELPGRREHDEFDEHPPFLAFLEKAKAMQPSEPEVRLGVPLFRV